MKISNPPVVELNAYSATQGKFVCIMINLVTIEFNREESQLRFALSGCAYMSESICVIERQFNQCLIACTLFYVQSKRLFRISNECS